MPDENTIRHFRNRLTETETLPLVHELFERQLYENGFLPKRGQVVYGTSVHLPRQRFTKEEKGAIEAGMSDGNCVKFLCLVILMVLVSISRWLSGFFGCVKKALGRNGRGRVWLIHTWFA